MYVSRRIVNISVVYMFVYYFGKMSIRNVNMILEWYTVGEKGTTIHYFTEYRE